MLGLGMYFIIIIVGVNLISSFITYYHTKYKEEIRPETDSFLDRWKKSSKLRGSNY